MDLARGDVDGSPEFERTGAITEAYEPRPVDAFAVVFLMGHQYKVTVDDLVFVDRMDGVEVNDELSLNRVMLIGTHAETVIGRPIVPGAIVKAGESRCSVSPR